MRKILLIVCLLVAQTVLLYAQEVKPVDSSGYKLRSYYLSLDVEHLWLAGHHVNWETGQPDKADATKNIKTHCSVFVATACKRLKIYILRPPQHSPTLLANAQYDWLSTSQAYESGWHPITGAGMYSIYTEAQNYANDGYVVVAVYRNSIPKKSGHIALIMPANITLDDIKQGGPHLIMAGAHNYNEVPLLKGFKKHITTWPDSHIVYYYYANNPVY